MKRIPTTRASSYNGLLAALNDGGFNVPGFHIHFLSGNRYFGGYVRDFQTGDDVVASIVPLFELDSYAAPLS